MVNRRIKKLRYLFVASLVLLILIYFNESSSIRNLNNDLICAVRTNKSYLKRAKAVFETWGKECDRIVFLASNFTDEIPIVSFDIDDDLVPYEKITKKMYAVLPKLYQAHPGYKWYLIGDDDTFVYVDNLRTFLSTKIYTDNIIYGRICYNGEETPKSESHLAGGSSYIIPNHGMSQLTSKILNDNKYCPFSNVDDKDISQCLRMLGFKYGQTRDENGMERFNHENNFKDKRCCTKSYISFHHLTPPLIYNMYKFRHNLTDYAPLINDTSFQAIL